MILPSCVSWSTVAIWCDSVDVNVGRIVAVYAHVTLMCSDVLDGVSTITVHLQVVPNTWKIGLYMGARHCVSGC